MPHILSNPEQTTGKESSYVSLHGRAISPDQAGDGIEAFSVSYSHGVPLYIKTKSDKRWNRVRQVQERGRGYDGNETKVIRNRCRDDERRAPPDWHESGVEDFARLSHQ